MFFGLLVDVMMVDCRVFLCLCNAPSGSSESLSHSDTIVKVS